MITVSQGLFLPIRQDDGPPLHFTFDGALRTARQHDTVLAALLRQDARTGSNEFDGAPRAGFCLMGSCQDCTVWDQDGRRLRACMEEVRDGQVLRSTPYDVDEGDD